MPLRPPTLPSQARSPFSDPSNILLVPLTSANSSAAVQSTAGANYYQFQADDSVDQNFTLISAVASSTVASLQTIQPIGSSDQADSVALDIPDSSPTSIPEPAAFSLLGIALLGAAVRRAIQARG